MMPGHIYQAETSWRREAYDRRPVESDEEAEFAMYHVDPDQLPHHGGARMPNVNLANLECDPRVLPVGGRGNRCASPQAQRLTCSHFVRGSPGLTHYHHSTPSHDPRSEHFYSPGLIPADRLTSTSMQAAPSPQQRLDLIQLEAPRSLLSNCGDYPYNRCQYRCCQQPAPQVDRASSGIPQFNQCRDEASDCCRGQPHMQLQPRLRPQTRQPQMIGTEFAPQISSVTLTDQQRKVFVTYSRDNECHTREVNRFVSWLCSNGFYTEIDMLNKLVQSMDNVEYMLRFLNDKNYLIIMAVSPKYQEDVESVNDSDQHSLQTRFIYQQLVNEYISNGSKNFRLIPVLFPGSRKDHIPTWLKNTSIYHWPLNQEDILRRVCRIEKYSIPPPGPLPIIVSKSLG
uniref:E3 ubiquitin ligase TRAF3IP2-like isoform X2 n=1 Tax=Myxine glutinosa TaxID=7769 RepID=UPI00358FD8B8